MHYHISWECASYTLIFAQIQYQGEDASATLGTRAANEGENYAIVSTDDPLPPWMTARSVVEVEDKEAEDEVSSVSYEYYSHRRYICHISFCHNIPQKTLEELMRLRNETEEDSLQVLAQELVQAQDSEWEKFREVDRIKMELQQVQNENAELKAEVKASWESMGKSAKDAVLKKIRSENDPKKAIYIAQFNAELQKEQRAHERLLRQRDEVPITLEEQKYQYQEMIDDHKKDFDRTEDKIKEQQKQVVQTTEKLLEIFGKENDTDMIVVLDDIKTGLNSGNVESAMGVLESLITLYVQYDSLAVTRREKTQALTTDMSEDLMPNLKPKASTPAITKPELPSAQETEDEAKKDDGGMRAIQKTKRLYELVKATYGPQEQPAASGPGGRAPRASMVGKGSNNRKTSTRPSPKASQKLPEQANGPNSMVSKRSFSFLAK